MSTAPSSTPLPRPTEAELDILRILWERGDCTVREVHEALHGSDGAGYTTALKLMQIMHAKGLVERNDSQRAHIYRAAVSQQRTQKRFLAEMVTRLFNGSPSQLVLHALGDNPRASKAELEQIRQLLDRLDAREKSR
jgi:predicted transcriptional regulator